MRKLMYKVRDNKGEVLHTSSYTQATENGCKILDTYLVPVDERTSKEKDAARVHAHKVQAKMMEKRA